VRYDARVKIIVAIKQVPAPDSQLAAATDGQWIDEASLSFEINEPDAYALEEALQLKEKHGGEVVVLCAGSSETKQTIREALAKGADRAIHIEAENIANADPLTTGDLLAAAVRQEGADLVLTGLQSDDLGYGQTGVVLAELLGWTHATIVMQVEASDTTIRVKRELEGGWFQHVSMPLPAVLTVQSGINKLRYASLMGIKKAKTKEVREASPQELGVDVPDRSSIARVYVPERSKQTQLLEGTPSEVAAQLVEKLRFEVRAL
jgi:electron transfer flavoprotein beta subunit